MDWTPPTPARMLTALDRTWAALERRRLGEWTLRRGGGGGSRASSVMAGGAAPADLDAALAAVAATCAAWGQPALFQLGPDDAALEAALEARGWPVADSNLILAAPAAALAARGTGGTMVVEVAARLAALEELWAAGGVGPARLAVMAAVAVPKTALLLRADDRPAGAAFVAADAEVAVMSALWIAPRARRAGLGRAAVAAAAGWAAAQGCATLGLAVGGANAGARALYAGLGFVEVCGYRYRRAP